MTSKKTSYSPFMKNFYRVSKERFEAYIEKLDEANEIFRKLRPENDKGSVDWEKIEKAWGKIIDVSNSLLGFRYYEDAEAGGEIVDDFFLYNGGVELDNHKFFKTEFPNGLNEKGTNKHE